MEKDTSTSTSSCQNLGLIETFSHYSLTTHPPPLFICLVVYCFKVVCTVFLYCLQSGQSIRWRIVCSVQWWKCELHPINLYPDGYINLSSLTVRKKQPSFTCVNTAHYPLKDWPDLSPQEALPDLFCPPSPSNILLCTPHSTYLLRLTIHNLDIHQNHLRASEVYIWKQLDPSSRIWIGVGRDVAQASAFFKLFRGLCHLARVRPPWLDVLRTGVTTSKNSDSLGQGGACARGLLNSSLVILLQRLVERNELRLYLLCYWVLQEHNNVMSRPASLFLRRLES